MTLYDFYADWCQPCKMMTPIIDQLEKDRPDITIIRVNADESPETCRDYDVRSIPTYILVDGGTEKRISGAAPRAKFLASLGLNN